MILLSAIYVGGFVATLCLILRIIVSDRETFQFPFMSPIGPFTITAGFFVGCSFWFLTVPLLAVASVHKSRTKK